MWTNVGLVTEFIILILITYTIQQKTDNIEKFLQPDDVGERYDFAPRNDNWTCTRECLPNSPPRLCYYQFNVENYATLSGACMNCINANTSCDLPQCVTADGFERGFLSVNRRLPGPSIQVCYGDRIMVDVRNLMLSRSVTIHWHGIFQKGTQYDDGVPMISQCPIPESTAHRYDFYANQPGTFFWHSHDGIQKIDGLQGSLIIRRPKENEPNGDEYDYDLPAHVIFLTDWYHMNSDEHFPGLNDPNLELYGTYFLINGRGRYKDLKSGNMTKSPYTAYRVTPGKRYRFRIIGATCSHCFTRMSIEGHRLKVIATDANSVTPVEVDYLDVYTGERYDIVLTANKDIKSYRIRVVGLGIPCEESGIYQLAIIKYDGSKDEFPTTLSDNGTFQFEGVALNPENSTCTGQRICVAQLNVTENFNKSILNPVPDISYKMTFGYYYPTVQEEFQTNTFKRYLLPDPFASSIMFWINNISEISPPSPLLSQRADIPSNMYCNADSKGMPVCDKDICHCLHILHIPLGSLAQFILIDKSDVGGFNHPFHFHGYSFNVMAMGYKKSLNNENEIEELMKTNEVPFSPAPVLKDTIIVPSAGYAVIRFMANNPGYWLFHCHFVHHHVVGMSLVVQVGEPEEIPPVPRGFPKCGNYLPMESFK